MTSEFDLVSKNLHICVAYDSFSIYRYIFCNFNYGIKGKGQTKGG